MAETPTLPYVNPVVSPTVLSAAWIGGAEAGVRQTANRVAMAKAVLQAQTSAGIAAMEARSRNAALASQERLEASKQANAMKMFMAELNADTAARAQEFENKQTLARMEIEARKELQEGDPARKFKQMQMDALEQWDTASDEEKRALSLRLAAGTSALGDELGYQRFMSGMTGEADASDPRSDAFWIQRSQGDMGRARADRARYEQVVVPTYQAAVAKAKHWAEQTGSMEAMQNHARAVNELLEAEAALRSYWGATEVEFPFGYDESILKHVTQRQREEAAEGEDEREAADFSLLDKAFGAPRAAMSAVRSEMGDVTRRGLAGYGLNVARRAIGAEKEATLREAAEKATGQAIARGTKGLTRLLLNRLGDVSIMEEDTGPRRPGESMATNVTARLPQPGNTNIVYDARTQTYKTRQQ